MTGRRIVRTPGTCNGRPRIDGTGIGVHDVVERFLFGESIASIAADYRLTTEDVDNALRFHMRQRLRNRGPA